MKKRVFLCLLCALVLSCCAAAALDLSTAGEETAFVYLGSFDGEPIVWRVLSSDGESALLLSEKILFTSPIDSRTEGFPGWEYAELYARLNGEFLKAAFSLDEKGALLYQDDLSLVSIPDRLKAASLPSGRTAYGTADAKNGGLYIGKDGFSPYWTRSESERIPGAFTRAADDGTLGDLPLHTEGLGVRPVILADIRGVTILSGSGSLSDPYALEFPSAITRPDRVSPTPRPVTTPEPTAQPTELPTAEPAAELPPVSSGPRIFPTEYTSLFPELTEEGFLPEGAEEFTYADPDQGLWLYASRDLRIEIVRRADTTKRKKPKRWLEADIFVRAGSGLFPQNYYPGGEPDGKVLADEAEIAKENRLVFAVNGDWYYYRVQKNTKKKTMTVGVILRRGEILFDDPAKKETTTLPTRDILALYPDGSMEPFSFNEISAQELVGQGVFDTLCFGPILIRDGEITKQTKTISGRQAENPRSGIGIAEDGHYVAIVAEGGTNVAAGMKLLDFAELFAQKGCRTAFNLNGGGAANMIFLGEYISQNKAASQNRHQKEVLGIGVTEQTE